MFFYLFSQSIIDILHSSIPSSSIPSSSIPSSSKKIYKFYKKNSLNFEEETSEQKEIIQEHNIYKSQGFLDTFATNEEVIYFFSSYPIQGIGFLFIHYKKPIKIWTLEGKYLENYNITYYDSNLVKQESLNTWQWIGLSTGFYLIGDDEISRSLIFVKEGQVFQKTFDEVEQKSWSMNIFGQAGEEIFKEYQILNQVKSKKIPPKENMIFSGDKMYIQMKDHQILFVNNYTGEILIERSHYYNAIGNDFNQYCFVQIYDPKGVTSYDSKEKSTHVLEGISSKKGFLFLYSFEENIYSLKVNNKSIEIPCIKGYYILSNI